MMVDVRPKLILTLINVDGMKLCNKRRESLRGALEEVAEATKIIA